METPQKNQRGRVEKETIEDLQKSVQQLLSDVHDESVNATPEISPITRTLARFASLQTKIILELERRNDRTQLWFAVLAIGSIVLSIASLLKK